MFQVVLLGLAASAAAVPLLRELVAEKEGVNLPIYKPWYNSYSSNIYGSQYDKIYSNYYSNNYDFTNISPYQYRMNFFSKYMRPEMINMNSLTFPEMLNTYMRRPYHSNMFGHMSDLLNYLIYNNMYKYDYMYRPYSNEYLDENVENIFNNDLSYSNDYSNFAYRPYSPDYMLSFMRYYMNKINPYSYHKNIYDYMYRPYSEEHMDFNNMFYQFFDKENQYFNYPEFINFKNSILPYNHNANIFDYSYRPFSLEYIKNMLYHNQVNDYDNIYRPYSTEYMNLRNTWYPFQDKIDSFNYKPYFSGYSQNSVATSYPLNNEHDYTFPNYHHYTHLKNSYYPHIYNVHGYKNNYIPYSPEYMYGQIQNFNMRYPYYNRYNHLNLQHPFYNNYFGGANYGPHQFPEYMKYKRELPQNLNNEEKLEVQRPIPQVEQDVVSRDLLNQPAVNVDTPVPRTRRNVEVTVPQVSQEEVEVNPHRVTQDREVVSRHNVAPQQPIETEHTRNARAVVLPAPQYYYPYRTVYPLYRTYPYTLTYPYHPLYYNVVYKK